MTADQLFSAHEGRIRYTSPTSSDGCRVTSYDVGGGSFEFPLTAEELTRLPPELRNQKVILYANEPINPYKPTGRIVALSIGGVFIDHREPTTHPASP